MDKSFVSKNLTCCSVELDWKNAFDENLNNNNIYYELEQKELMLFLGRVKYMKVKTQIMKLLIYYQIQIIYLP